MLWTSDRTICFAVEKHHQNFQSFVMTWACQSNKNNLNETTIIATTTPMKKWKEKLMKRKKDRSYVKDGEKYPWIVITERTKSNAFNYAYFRDMVISLNYWDILTSNFIHLIAKYLQVGGNFFSSILSNISGYMKK